MIRWGFFVVDGGLVEAFYPYNRPGEPWVIRYTKDRKVVFVDSSVAVQQPPVGPLPGDIEAMNDMVCLLLQEHGIDDTEARRK